MEGKPKDIDAEALKNGLLSIPTVREVHDLHIWSISSDMPSLSCHIVADENSDRDRILKQVSKYLRKECNVEHVTVQIEGERCSVMNRAALDQTVPARNSRCFSIAC